MKLKDAMAVGLASVAVSQYFKLSNWKSAALYVCTCSVACVFNRTLLGLKRTLWPLEQWALSGVPEDAIEPDRPIIDACHHFWDPSSQPKGWPVPLFVLKVLYGALDPTTIHKLFASDLQKNNPSAFHNFSHLLPILPPYMAPQLKADMQGISPLLMTEERGRVVRTEEKQEGRPQVGHNVVQTIYVESGWEEQKLKGTPMASVGEAVLAQGVADANSELCNAIVPFMDLRMGKDIASALEALKKCSNVRGVRHSLAWSPEKLLMNTQHCDENTMGSTPFREGLALLEKHGLLFETWLFHSQIPMFIDLAKAFPNTTMVLAHVGLPTALPNGIEAAYTEWKELMRQLSTCPNVNIKISGLGMKSFGFGFEDKAAPATSQALAEAWEPYVLHSIACFGASRCMFGSNFPVDKISGSYITVWNAYKRTVTGCSEEEKQFLFHDTAKRVYRL